MIGPCLWVPFLPLSWAQWVLFCSTPISVFIKGSDQVPPRLLAGWMVPSASPTMRNSPVRSTLRASSAGLDSASLCHLQHMVSPPLLLWPPPHRILCVLMPLLCWLFWIVLLGSFVSAHHLKDGIVQGSVFWPFKILLFTPCNIIHPYSLHSHLWEWLSHLHPNQTTLPSSPPWHCSVWVCTNYAEQISLSLRVSLHMWPASPFSHLLRLKMFASSSVIPSHTIPHLSYFLTLSSSLSPPFSSHLLIQPISEIHATHLDWGVYVLPVSPPSN